MRLIKPLRQSSFTLLLTLFISGEVFAANLLDIYSLAKTQDRKWAAAQSHYQANIEKGPQGDALLRPSIHLSALYADNRDTTNTSLGSTIIDDTFSYDTNGYRLQLIQPIYNKANFAGYKQGQISVKEAEYVLSISRAEFIFKTARVYLDVLSSQDALKTAKADELAVKKQLNLMQRNYQVGSATSIDVQDAKARYDLSVSQVLLAQTLLNKTRQALRVVINIEPPPLAKVVVNRSLPAPTTTDIEQLAKTAAINNLQVLATEQLVANAEMEVERNRGGHYPRLDLVASHSYNDAGGSVFGSSSEVTSNQLMLQINLPLYQGGRVDSKVREALARRNELRDNLEQLRRQAGQQAREIGLSLINEFKRIKKLQTAVNSNKKALQATILGFEKGLRSGLDILNSQQQLTRTRLALSQARHGYLLNQLRLKVVLGIINEQNLEEINRLLG